MESTSSLPSSAIFMETFLQIEISHSEIIQMIRPCCPAAITMETRDYGMQERFLE